MSQQRGGVREAAAVLSVVLSLLFVGWEIRQNTKVARGQTRVELTALNNGFLQQLVGEAEFSEIWRTAWIEHELLDPASEYRVEFTLLQYLRLLENVHLQHQEGLLDREALNSYGFLGFRENFMSHPRFDPIWRRMRSSFNSAFVSFLEGEV